MQKNTIGRIDEAFQELIEQSQRSIFVRGALAIETLIFFALAKINAGLLPSTGTFDRRSRLKTKWERDLANNVGATGASAVLLDYTRREEKGLSARLTRRIRRMMHHSVDLQPFQATVQILNIEIDDDEEDDLDQDQDEEELGYRLPSPPTSPIRSATSKKTPAPHTRQPSKSSRSSKASRSGRKRNSAVAANRSNSPLVVMYTPMSFPPSPGARANLLSDFSSATHKLLTKASSILQDEAEQRRATAVRNRTHSNVNEDRLSDLSNTSTNRSRSGSVRSRSGSVAVIQFGVGTDLKHPDIKIQCGGHLVEYSPSLSSSSSSTPASNNNACATVRSSMPLSMNEDVNIYYEYHLSHLSNTKTSDINNLQIGVGLQTAGMRLFECASGNNSGRSRGKRCCGALFSKQTGLKLGTTIGILCKVRHSPNQEVCTTTIHFSLNGQPLDTLTDSITVKNTEQLWPSLSLSSNVMVLGLFSSSDLRYPPDDAKDVVGLDGVSV